MAALAVHRQAKIEAGNGLDEDQKTSLLRLFAEALNSQARLIGFLRKLQRDQPKLFQQIVGEDYKEESWTYSFMQLASERLIKLK